MGDMGALVMLAVLGFTFAMFFAMFRWMRAVNRRQQMENRVFNQAMNFFPFPRRRSRPTARAAGSPSVPFRRKP